MIKQIDTPRLSRSVKLDKGVNKGEEAVLEDNLWQSENVSPDI